MNSNYGQIPPRASTIGVNVVCDINLFTGEFTTYAPGEIVGYGPLIRDYCVIRYCTDGSGLLVINGKEFRISAGKGYAILAGDIVSEINDTDKPLSFAHVSIYGVKALPYLKEMGISSQTPFFPWEENYSILQIIKEIISVANEFMRKDEFLRSEKTYKLLGALRNYVREFNKSNSSPPPQEKYILNALNFMEANYNKKITASDVAKHIGINRSYFYCLFKEHMGHSPTDHLISLRINKACELLLLPRATVASVANAVGMDEALFHRQFKRVCLTTPAKYRNRETS